MKIDRKTTLELFEKYCKIANKKTYEQNKKEITIICSAEFARKFRELLDI